MDMWGPARVSGRSRERYFLLIVDDYTRYTTVFPLRSKGQVVDVLIPWICTVRLQLRERFGQDLPVLRLHSDRGGEFSSNLLWDFCRGEGILQSFTLPDSPHQNGIVERRIDLVMEVARTSMIHAAAPHFHWPFAVRYPAHQLNLWPRVSLPETSPTLHWTGEVGDASVFRVWGSRAFVRDTSADKLSPRAIPFQLREWFVRCTRLRSGASGARGAGPAEAGGTGVAAGDGVTGAAGTGGVEGAGAGDLTESGTTGAGGAEVGGPGVGGPRAGGARAVDPGGAVRPRPYFPASPLLAPSPYTEQSGGLTERRRESDRPRAASPTVSRLLAIAVTDPSFESAAASALVAELLDFAAACRLDYAIALIAESASASPPSVGGECALGTNVLEDRQEDFESLAAAVPRFASMLLAPEKDPDAPDIPTPRSYEEAITGTYVDEVPPPGANIVDGMWIFRVKRPSGSPPAFKARYVARGFSQRQGVDYFQTFSPTPKMTTLRVLLHVAAQRDYELHSLDFSTAFQQGSLHEEIWLRRPPGFTESFPTGTQWSLRRLVYGLRQAPHEWHDTLRTTLAAIGFAPATADPSFFLRTDTLLPPFYVLVYVDDLVFATADTEALTLVKSELQKRHTCIDLGELRSYLGLHITRDRARCTITLT
ncbi:unnamed protein product [Closterium sp. NIES-54]